MLKLDYIIYYQPLIYFHMLQKKGKQTKAVQQPQKTKEKVNYTGYSYLIFIALYLLIDIAPREKIVDTSYQQRFYIDIINVIASIYIFANFAKFREPTQRFFSNTIPILYAGFIFFAILSLGIAYSPLEGVVTLGGYISNFWVLANLFMLLYAARDNIKAVAMIVTCTLFYQVSAELYRFYQELGTINIDALILSMKSNMGNKNIFAATVVIKLSIAYYSALRNRGFFKIFAYITVFISVLMLFLLSARAAYISLTAAVLLLAIGNIWLYWKEEAQRKKSFIDAGILLLIFAVCFSIANNSLTKYQYNAETQQASELAPAGSFVGSRIASIADDSNSSNSIRIAMWKEALKAWSEKPLSGYGAGNYRIYSDKITKKHYTSNVFFRHAHNDFVEVLFESGPFAFIAYLGLFIAALWFSIRTLFQRTYSKERKFVALVLLAAGFGFFVDSFFNFPLPRANMNVLFTLILTLIILNYLGGRRTASTENNSPQNKTKIPYLYVLVVALGTAAFYINYQSYSSGKSEFLVDGDIARQNVSAPKPKYTYAQVSKMFDQPFPLLGAQGGEPIKVKKAKYLFFENRDAEALRLLDTVALEAPYALHDERLKTSIYFRQEKLDSAYKYSKIMHEEMPYSLNHFKMRTQLAGSLGQVEDIKQAFHSYDAYAQDQESYELFIKQLAINKYDFNTDKALLTEGLKRYPDSKLILAVKKYYDIVVPQQKKN